MPVPKASFPPNIAAYLAKRAVSAPWRICPPPQRTFAGAVVIPSLAESANLRLTLESLSHNPADLLDRFMVLVVVNQRVDAGDVERNDNLATLAMLPEWKKEYRLEHLCWVDTSSPGQELPARQGVGLARKIGLDLSLLWLDYRAGDPLLVCLDADTLVQPDYLPAIVAHFSGSSRGGASIPYRHRQAEDPQGQRAIERYELFLRSYVLGLELAASPYAFHTVGSAMACRASAYVAAGGMNRRLAGEDFYFLQQVHKTSGVAPLAGTIVHPSPRSSLRVPFGTGRSVGDILAEGEQRLMFYRPQVFSILGEWLECVAGSLDSGGSELLERAGRIAPVLRGFLEQAGFRDAWDGLLNQNRDPARLAAAFHGWFDAFRTMRLIHVLSDQGYARISPEEAVPPLLARACYQCPGDLSGMLRVLRSSQGV
ncbi:MAG: hypothetical protein A2X82_11570 [Geobacteraceae bacterium GWC2_55_20]|nr:MAG: hypothetical protein A2X82_11570 [Geobacteraceae bacterium GWC2_55_20]HCE66966.1 hypothetical protein [Geobacter sp.]